MSNKNAQKPDARDARKSVVYSMHNRDGQRNGKQRRDTKTEEKEKGENIQKVQKCIFWSSLPLKQCTLPFYVCSILLSPSSLVRVTPSPPPSLASLSLPSNRLSFPHLGRPPINALASAAHGDPVDSDRVHAGRVFEPRVGGHATGIGALFGHELQQGQQEIGNAAPFFVLEVVFLAQNIGQGPVAETVDVAQVALSIKNLL